MNFFKKAQHKGEEERREEEKEEGEEEEPSLISSLELNVLLNKVQLLSMAEIEVACCRD